MLNFIKTRLHTLYTACTEKLNTFFARPTVNEETLHELEQLLIEADTGVKTTHFILDQLRTLWKHSKIVAGDALRNELQKCLINILASTATYKHDQYQIFLLVGINGAGKTTCASKLAYYWMKRGKKVLLVAADTFRAAAVEQLNQWAQQHTIPIVVGTQEQDPASVIFTGCERFKKEAFDILIIDTAGRLQTKTNLMHELTKMKRVISKQLPHASITTLLTIDALLGQNSFLQAQLFKESTDVNGIILTKMDGTGKGGIVFALAHELQIPIAYFTFGEQIEQLEIFDTYRYVDELLYQ